MPDPFAAALEAVFTAPGSAAAEYWPVDGAPSYPVRVIRSRAEQTARMGDAQIISDSEMIDLRKSEVAVISPGDRLRIGAIDADGTFAPSDHLIITGEAVTDVEDLTWTAGAERIAPFP